MAVHRGESHRSRHHTILIASEPLLAAWNGCCSSSKDVTAIPTAEAGSLVDTIRRQQPAVVVIEETFAGAEGAPFVTQLQSDHECRGIEIRLLSAERSTALQTAHTQENALARVATFARPVPLRRHVRLRPELPVEVVVDGHPASLLDLSVSGIQVRSSVTLCPNQRVRVNVPQESGSIKTSGVVAWSAFEIRSTPTYRAGIKLKEPFTASGEEVLARVLAAHILT